MKTVLLSLLIFVGSACTAQSGSNFFDLKNFTPPSPEAAALGRYGDIPTDLSTGVPKIEIPVHQIKSGKLSASVSLSYHASGIKFQDVPTPVGLGWVLNAGGSLSRIVVGNEDESSNGLLHMNTNYLNTYRNRDSLENVRFNSNTYTYLENLSNGTYDCQSDIYYYSAGDISGKFMYDVDQHMHFTPADRQPSIIYNADTTFTIIDDAGNKYYYQEKEYTQTFTYTHLTAWHLTKIVSADQADSINYYYVKGKTFNETNVTDNYGISVLNVMNSGYGPQCPLGNPTSSFTTTNTYYYHERKLIDSIAFQNGNIKFGYVNDRQDILPERLATIKIRNSDELLQEIQLVQGYFVSGGDTSNYAKRLRLDSVLYKDNSGNPVNNYALEYNAKELPTFRRIDSSYITTTPEIDIWGYYNDNSGLTSIPKGFYNEVHQYLVAITDGGFPPSPVILAEYLSKSSSRYANPDVMDACMIKKISSPTGGYTMFEFEANRYLDSGDSSDYRGGLRVSRIVSFDTINRQPIIKTFQYDSALSISQWFPQDLYYQKLGIKQSICPGPLCLTMCQLPQFYITASPSSSINYYNSSPVIYQKVTEFDGYPGIHKGKTVYLYEGNPDSSYNVPYSNKYWNFSTDKSWARGNLLGMRIYKTENDSDILIKETRNYYADFKTENVKVGYLCERATLMLDNMDFQSYLSDSTINSSWHDPLLQHYEYLDVVLPMGVKKLIKTEEFDYYNTELKNTKFISYESSKHLYPTKTSTLTSITNDTLYELFKYPQDRLSIYGLTDTASNAYEGMEEANMLNSPVQIDEYRNGQFLTQNRITFREWSSGKFYEHYRFGKKGSSLIEARTHYKNYDSKGNPLTMSLAHGSDVSYVWGYNGEYPVAQVTNAASNEIAYTSFENGDNGNWTGGGLGSVSSSAFTGERVGSLSGGLAKYNLPTGKKYIVSYWSSSVAATVTWYNSTYTASGTPSALVKKTKNGWTLFEHELPITTANVTVSGSGLMVDEVRLYPSDAQMVTTTFKPHVGVTSTNSSNGIITYYEYDHYGRLGVIRDQDKHIIKTTNYIYGESQDPGSLGWKATDSVRSVVGISSFSTGILERKERDKNPSSPTYNNIRWVPFSLGSTAPYWVFLDSSRCIKNSNNENTGYQEGFFVDENPYSALFRKRRWIANGYNETACPLPCTAPNRKIVDGICETGVRVDTGAFYDSETGLWTCVYHYEWTDKTSSVDYIDYNQIACNEEV